MSKLKLMVLLLVSGCILTGCVKAQVEDVNGIWEYQRYKDNEDATKSMKFVNNKKVSVTDKLKLYATSGFDGDVAFVAKCTQRDEVDQCLNVSIALMNNVGTLLNDFDEFRYPELALYNKYPAFLINVAPDGVYRLYPLQQNVISMEEAGAKSVIFANDRFLVEKDGMLGFIGRNGKIAIEPMFMAAQTFVDGKALAVDKNGILGMLTPEGQFYPQTFACMAPINENYTMVNAGGFLVDFSKDKRIKPNSMYVASNYSVPEGAYFCGGGHWGLIDKDEKLVIPAEYQAVQIGTHYHVVQNDEGKQALMSVSGQPMTEFNIDQMSFITDDNGAITSQYAVVRRGDKWGVLAADGKMVVPFEYEQLGPESEGYIAFKRGQLWGFLDVKGEEAFAPLFTEVHPFISGRAEAVLDGKPTNIYRDESARKAWLERDRLMNQEMQQQQYQQQQQQYQYNYEDY